MERVKVIGIVVEYNPFHNGHIYQIKKIKEKYKNSIIIVVMSSSFTQRGEYSILDKWSKTKICLENNIDLVVELPYKYSSQSSDIFAYGAIKILNELKCDVICFGSESSDINTLEELARTQINNNEFDKLVNSYINSGNNYPTSLNKALFDLTGKTVNDPNDLLNISYLKEIYKLNNNIDTFIIKRTSDYHDLISNEEIISASNIRNKILLGEDTKKYVPSSTYKYIKNINLKECDDNYLKLLKYKINTTSNLNVFNTVDEGIENRIMKYINSSKTLEELINNVKTKRYTYNRIKRMFTHIICDFKKEDNIINLEYIRILGFNELGKKHLNSIKNNTKLKIITKYDNILDNEYKITKVYSIITNKNSLIEEEYKNRPIIK